MGAPTGTLTVTRPGEKTVTYTWNGEVADRERAKAAFDAMIATNASLAFVFDSPTKARQVSSFSEVLDAEKETGTVTAQITSALQGG